MYRYRFLRFPGGKEKAVTLSYDDGCVFDCQLAEIIQKYGMKCTFNINSGFVSKSEDEWRLSYAKIKECLLKNGNEIAVHGKYHRAPGLQAPIEVIKDVLECRLELEQNLNLIIRGMAYPDSGITAFTPGSSYSSIKQNLTDLGIVYARTLGGDNDSFALPTDWHAWMPTAHHNHPKIFEYIEKFVNTPLPDYLAAQSPLLFYLWGHSFEFDRDSNWEQLEEICKRLSGQDNIWYATNIEIYNYIEAYRSLIFSADGNFIYNPTLLTVWLSVDGQLISIKSGETFKL